MFEDADGGTLFLDEVGELSTRAQAKLLRVIQEGEVRRVGENASRRIDTRLVAATNRSTARRSDRRALSADLLYRLDVVRINVPPLRERPEDIVLLARLFWRDATMRMGSRATLHPGTVAALARYHWPGNVRELQNVVSALAVNAPLRGAVTAARLPARDCGAGRRRRAAHARCGAPIVRGTLRPHRAGARGQSPGRAARDLGLTRQGLRKLLVRLRIEIIGDACLIGTRNGPRRRAAAGRRARATRPIAFLMLAYIARRLVMTLPVLFGVATLVFALLHLVPGDPAVSMLGESASVEDVRALRTKLGLDRPLAVQYRSYLTGALRGDLGVSFRFGTPVTREIATRVPQTLLLAASAMVVATLLALPLGRPAAVFKGRAADRSAMTLRGDRRCRCLPSGWDRCWLWCSASSSGSCRSPDRLMAHLVLPSLTLGFALAALLARMTRTTLLDELRELYVLAARARGASRWRAVVAHALAQQPDSGRDGRSACSSEPC